VTQRETYLLDTNVFIDAARRYYAFNLAPGFWTSLVTHAGNGHVRSIDRVKRELERGNDDVAMWSDTDFAGAFDPTDDARVFTVYSGIMEWIGRQERFLSEARAEAAESADSWLVAYAKVYGYAVVTHELPSPTSKKRVKLPDLCLAFRVPYVNPFAMLQRLGVRLVEAPRIG